MGFPPAAARDMVRRLGQGFTMQAAMDLLTVEASSSARGQLLIVGQWPTPLAALPGKLKFRNGLKAAYNCRD